MPIQAPNFAEALAHCEFVAGQRDPAMTFQVFDDKSPPDPDKAGIIHGRMSDPNVRKWLTQCAAAGCGVFFTLNETDGKGRRRANMTRYRVTGLDLDGAPLPAAWPRPPDRIVESSPGRFHVYWKLQPGTDWGSWSSLQSQVAAFFGGDKKVFDPPRVFRLPGFYHQKSTPFRTKLLETVNSFEAPPTVAELAMDHPCEFTPPQIREKTFDFEGVPDDWDQPEDIEAVKAKLTKTKAVTGERNHTAFALAAYANDHAISRVKSIELLSEWNAAQDDPLPESEIEAVVDHAPEYKRSPAGSAAFVDPVDDFADVAVDPKDLADLKAKKAEKISRFAPKKVSELLAMANPKWLVRGIIIEGGLAEIYGAFKTGKTFWAVEIACCVATGHEFDGVPVKQGKVKYIIAEGSRKLFAYRMDAWARARSNGDEDERKRLLALIESNIDVIPVPVIINDAEQVKAFIAANSEKCALTVIDTLFRSFRGNVGEAEAFSKFIEGCDLIRRKCDCTVLFLHHQKRNDAKGGFGSVVGEASVDVAIAVRRKGKRQTQFRLEIMRDGDTDVLPWLAEIEISKIDAADMQDEDVNSVGVLKFLGRKPDDEDDDSEGGPDVNPILESIYHLGNPTVAELAEHFSKTERTMQRDLADLRDAGLIDKGTKLPKLGLAKVDPASEFRGDISPDTFG